MKKIVSILFVVCSLSAYADDCSNAYRAGLDLFKSGKYSEAQIKFIAVDEACHGYSDVYNMLRACNKKLAEKQTQQTSQITSLKAEIKQLSQADKTNDGASSAVLGKEAMSIVKNIDNIKEEAKQSKEQLQVANDSIIVLNNMLKDANAGVEQLRKDIESLNQRIDELKKPVSVTHRKTVAEIEKEIKDCKAALKVLKAEKKEAKKREKQIKSTRKNKKLS